MVACIGMEVGKQNIRDSVNSRDGVVEVMDELQRQREGGAHQWLPGSRQGALYCRLKGVRRDVGNENDFMGSGAESIELERIIRCRTVRKAWAASPTR